MWWRKIRHWASRIFGWKIAHLLVRCVDRGGAGRRRGGLRERGQELLGGHPADGRGRPAPSGGRSEGGEQVTSQVVF